MSYLDQIALVCLAAGLRACRAPDCLHYREKLERVVPVCGSWPGLRDWVLCITSCSLRAIRDINQPQTKVAPDNGNEESKVEHLRIELEDKNKSDVPINKYKCPEKLQDSLVPKEDEESKHGLAVCRPLLHVGLLSYLRVHLTACIVLITPPNSIRAVGWGGIGRPELKTLEETADKSDSIGGPRLDQTIYFLEKIDVVSSRLPLLTPEFLTCRRHANLALVLALHQCLGLTFICKHSILHLWVNQLMLLRFSN